MTGRIRMTYREHVARCFVGARRDGEHRLGRRSHVSILYMSWRKDEPGERDEPRGYHHGNLREALIRAALELIAKKGAAGFTFAEAARFAGVSPAAPYRHFRDREELLANVALRGFEQLAGADPPLRAASDRAFAVLRGAADKLCAAMPAAERPPALMVALHIWSMAHGVASLFGRGDGAQRALPIAAEELLEAHALIYLRGLALQAPRT
jgi:AcrR family transcriptional regulator